MLLCYAIALLSALTTLLAPTCAEKLQTQQSQVSTSSRTPSESSGTPARADVRFSIDFGSGDFVAGLKEPVDLSDKSIPTTGTDGKLLTDNARKFKAKMDQMRSKREQPHPLDAYTSVCKSSFDFYAVKYPSDPEYSEPALRRWIDELEGCFDGRPYPGNFSPQDKGYSLIQARYHWLPVLVRRWIEEDWKKVVEGDKQWWICIVNPDDEVEDRRSSRRVL